MRMPVLALSLVVAAATLAPSARGAEVKVESAPVNLVMNPSLEDALAESGLPAQWNPFSEPQDAFKAAVVEPGRTGKRSLKIVGDGKWGGVTTNRITLAADARFRLSGFVKLEGDAGAKASIKFDYFNDKSEWKGSHAMGELTPEDAKDWASVSCSTAEHPKEATKIAVTVSVLGKGTAWFDDLALTTLAGPTSLPFNGGFEENLGRRPGGLWLAVADGGACKAVVSHANPHAGEACLKIEGNADWAVGSTPRIEIKPGKTLHFTGFVKALKGSARIKIDFFKGDEYLGHNESEAEAGSDWTELSVTGTGQDYPEATHVSASAVVAGGEVEGDFDSFNAQWK
jgi:hypothetical protein